MNIPETLHESILNDPLYKKRIYKGGIPLTCLPDLPPINYHCAGTCKSTQTFSVLTVDNGQENKYHENLQQYAAAALTAMGGHHYSPLLVGDNVYHLTFRCLKCKKYKIDFVLSFAEQEASGIVAQTTIQKIGQLPPLESTLDADIEKWLSETDGKLYKKGVRCEAYGFGIAAFSYFRRIVENNIQKILDEVAETTDSQELIGAIEAAKKQHNAADRLKLVKDHAPQSFMAGDQNVFAIIYGALSEGLHAGSDEECLSAATNIRVCLHFLIKKIAVAAAEKKRLDGAIKQLAQPLATGADTAPKS